MTQAGQGQTKLSNPVDNNRSRKESTRQLPSPQGKPEATPIGPAKIQWSPSSFLIIAMFLLGLSRLDGKAIAIATVVAMAGLASFVQADTEVRETLILLVPWESALIGLLAYLVGRHLVAYLADLKSPIMSMRPRAGNWLAPSVLLVAAVAASWYSMLVPEPQGDGRSMALLAFASALSWSAAIRIGEYKIGFGLGLAWLVGWGLFSCSVMILVDLASSGGLLGAVLGSQMLSKSPLFGSVSAPFLPAMSFVLGRLCQSAVLEAVAYRTVTENEQTVDMSLELRMHMPPIFSRKNVIPSKVRVAKPTNSNRRIVILIDGPGMGYGESASNVLKLYMCLQGEQASTQQMVFYISTAGTGSVSPWSRLRQDMFGIFALATGYSLDMNVLAGYEFLVKNYQEGDDIYLFGFGQGAYAARVVAGLVHKIGLVSPQQLDLLGAGLTAYKRFSGSEQLHSDGEDEAAQFARAFSTRRPAIRFVGVWDTVAPIIVPRPDRLFLPTLRRLAFTTMNPSVKSFRQAISMDERRVMFRVVPWGDQYEFEKNSAESQDSLQVWFAGVHADVGGGYAERESGLSKFPLIWMVEEAAKLGLSINQVVFEEVAWGVQRKGSTSSYVAPDFTASLHNSLLPAWRLLEFLPKSTRLKEWPARRSFLGFYIPDGEPRLVPEDALIHEGVVRRTELIQHYRPLNLPSRYQIVPMTEGITQHVHSAS